MNLKSLPTLPFRSRKFQERDDYARGSLSSLVVTSRLSRLSSSRGLKTDPFPLRFHDEWRHAECKVMEWYGQVASSTQIASIEHRRTLEAPFFHEFLLIHLADGAVCRLERMGDGSRVDAVRGFGCIAHDLVQWFPAKRYLTTPLALQPSEIVIHVQFPILFDLLDVFAICYSITQHRRASIYTLQRYNCYFVCNAILTLLARRVAEWETKLITPETWPNLVDDVLEELPQKKHDDPFDYFGIGICSLLEPDCPNVVSDVVNLLRSELKSDAYCGVVRGMADTLWHKDLQSAILASLSDHVETATNKASNGGDVNAIGLKTLFIRGNRGLYPDAELGDPAVQRMLIKHFMSIAVKHTRRHALDLYRGWKMKKVEHGCDSSRYAELLAMIIGPFAGWWHFNIDGVRNIMGVGDKLDVRTRARFELSRISFSLSIGRIHALMELDDTFKVAYSERNDKATRVELCIGYEHCRSPVIDTRSKALCLLNKLTGQKEWAYSLRYCLARLLMEAISGRANSAVITVLGSNTSSCSTTDMHTHIQQRIQEHAKRVEGYQLAAAQLVEEDIERVMSEIWMSLPKGFGGVAKEG